MNSSSIRKNIKWVLLAIFVVEMVLVLSGLLPSEIVVLAISATEGTALALTLSVVVPGVISIAKRVSKNKVSVTAAAREEFEGAVPSPVLRLLEGELGILSAIVRAIVRRPDYPEGSVPISYGKTFRTMGYVLIGVAPIEIVLADLLCTHFAPNYFALRIIIVAISVYAFIWIVGLVLATKVYPHFLTTNKAVFRYCNYKRIEIPLKDIQDVNLINKDCGRSKMLYTEGDMLCLNNGANTSELAIVFKRKIKPLVNGRPWPESVSSFAFSVDDPKKTRESIRTSLALSGVDG